MLFRSGGDSTFDGNLIPNLNNTFNIGSSSKRWKDLWLGGTTIYIGDASISTDVNGNLVVSTGNGNQFSVSNVNPGSSTFTANVSGSVPTPVQAVSNTIGGNQYRIINAGTNTVFLGIGSSAAAATSNAVVVSTTGQ